jgi:hypothetical protein
MVDTSVIHKVMPCWAWVAPLIWCFIPSWLLAAKSWNFIKWGMKYWDSRLNALGSRTFIVTVHIAATVIGWSRSAKERTGQTQFSTKFAAKLSFMPPLKLSVLFFRVLWNLIAYVTKQGVSMLCFPDFTYNFTVRRKTILIIFRPDLWNFCCHIFSYKPSVRAWRKRGYAYE